MSRFLHDPALILPSRTGLNVYEASALRIGKAAQMFREVGFGRNGNAWMKVLPVGTRRGWTLYSRERVRLGDVSVSRFVSLGHGSSADRRVVIAIHGDSDDEQWHDGGCDHSATWTSSDPNVATVTPGGLVTAIAEGTASIQATFDNISGSEPTTVFPASNLP